MPTPHMSGNGQYLRIMRRMVALTQRDSGETTRAWGSGEFQFPCRQPGCPSAALERRRRLIRAGQGGHGGSGGQIGAKPWPKVPWRAPGTRANMPAAWLPAFGAAGRCRPSPGWQNEPRSREHYIHDVPRGNRQTRGGSTTCTEGCCRHPSHHRAACVHHGAALTWASGSNGGVLPVRWHA